MKQRSKRLLSVLLTLVMLLGMVPGVAWAEGTENTEGTDNAPYTVAPDTQPVKKMMGATRLLGTPNGTALTQTNGELGAGSYYLSGDLTLTGTLTVSTGTVSLDLNGHVLKGNGSALVIKVTGGTLNITDSDPAAEHYFTKADKGVWMLNDSNTGEKITGGVITGGNNTTNDGGGAIYNGGGTVTMTGGNIVGNTATLRGGAICNLGTMTLDSVNVLGNTSEAGGRSHGGGIINGHNDDSHTNTSASLTLRNCKINYNSANFSDDKNGWGGGIFNGWNSNLTIEGSEVNNNYARKCAGGIQIEYGGTISITDTKIKDNTAGVSGQVGGMFVECNSTENKPTITFSGKVEIADNKDGGNNSSDLKIKDGASVSAYLITYNANGATGGSVPIADAVASGGSHTVLGNTGSLAKTDCTFGGWNTAADGSGTTYQTDATISNITGNITLYAVWQQDVSSVTLDNDGYPYGSAMTSSSVTLNAVIATGTASSWQWQRAEKSATAPTEGFSDISGATSASYTFTPASGDDGAWYRCVVNGTVYSKPVQLIKPSYYESDTFGRSWMAPYIGDPWYVSNGTMAYTMDETKKAFDVTGQFVKDGITYMLQTAFGGGGWQMYSDTSDKPSPVSYSYLAYNGGDMAQLSSTWFAFKEDDNHSLIITANLAAGQKSFAFGSDTQLGNSATSGSFADNAALAAKLNSDNTLMQVNMIGAETVAAAQGTDPAFVITPLDSAPRFWLGSFNGRMVYGWNDASSRYGCTTGAVKANEGDTATAVVEMNYSDSGMTMSWLNVQGGKVRFSFSVGDAGSTGAVSSRIDYINENLTGLAGNTEYTVTYTDKNGAKQTRQLTTDASGNLPLAGNGYDLFGETITVSKGEDAPLILPVAACPRPRRSRFPPCQ